VLGQRGVHALDDPGQAAVSGADFRDKVASDLLADVLDCRCGAC
jgi:hypothetical protein